ncbi:MAG TPA: DUF5682 family protein [Phycisphaerae bacterium]|nr:DUF5682 family protein [Phycisphaerae bacterium]
MPHHIYGIRHHGPGSARALLAALKTLRPDVVLIEGPPDAQDVLPLIRDDGLKLPVALMIYRADEPRHAVFYPFTVFSPEWQALNYAFEHQIPARFIDLPMTIHLAEEAKAMEKLKKALEEKAKLPNCDDSSPMPGAGSGDGNGSPQMGSPSPGDGKDPNSTQPTLREDPLGMLAEAAGYTDHELWWEHQIEQRVDATDLFEGILEAMTALRADAKPLDDREPAREAHMRQCIRAAVKEGFERIAVVCGAWHAPALVNLDGAKADTELLRGKPRTKVIATWTPWTNSRLSYRSGYGAGVASPGWYEHLWTARKHASARWATLAARLLRKKDLTASSAEVIDTVRLADALAAMRGLPLPGLAEMNEAILTVLCHGQIAPMALIRQKLEIGDRLGAVPKSTPTVPLQHDLENRQRKVRLKPSTEIKDLDLDLRKEGDLERSRLLHQVALLGIPWGEAHAAHGKRSTFHELWQIQWQPEFAVQVVEAGIWGRTVESAAEARVCHQAAEIQELPVLCELLLTTTYAQLPGAVKYLLKVVQDQAAVAADVRHLMNALPKLSEIARYGDVRGTKGEQVLPIIAGLFERILIGLPGACGSLDDEAAAQMLEGIAHVQESVDLLQVESMADDWQALLRKLMEDENIHGLVRGWCCRILVDKGAISSDELHRMARLALSPVVPILQAAAWVEGLLRGSGLTLLHQDGVWAALDAWLVELPKDIFTQTLPLLRRAFSGFSGPERRQMGEKVKRLRSAGAAGAAAKTDTGADNLDVERARRVLPVLAQILGVPYAG